ncbi:hypothetical protein SB6411_05616 [Klebsiella spallanzanii]|uniref:dATP/dGTP diphosphohydrolase MazZ domain-containing protein n=1 Tax=Klebsiella spallanzanii TaxID=2587528 RepID=A0ABY6VAY7_9ENTR|nr:Eaa1 [Klebsiella pneumoniae]VUS42586.1 hypothetical protein SB6411_05616 [Klebsiella spallanzanii]
MNKSAITRERLEWLSQISGRDDIEDVDGGEIRELSRAQLAAMDSEPAATLYHSNGRASVMMIGDLPLGEVDVYTAQRLAPEFTAIVERLNLSGYEYENGPVTARNTAAVVDILLQQLDDAVQSRDAQPALERDNVRREHAEWSQATFGNVGPIGPLKHLSKEALEAAAEPGDLSEWADMQFLLWDAQRRAGITDEQITQAMIEKLAVNKQREWPEPKDGEPRLHIKEQPAPVVRDERKSFESFMAERFGDSVDHRRAKNGDQGYMAWDMVVAWIVWQARAMLQAQSDYDGEPTDDERIMAIEGIIPPISSGNSPVIGVDLAAGPDRSVEVRYVVPPGYVMVPKEPTEDMIVEGFESWPDEGFSEPEVWEEYQNMSGCQQAAHRARLCWAAMIAAAPKQENI